MPDRLQWQSDAASRIPERTAAAVLRQAVKARPDDLALTLRLAAVLHAQDCQQEILDLLAPVVARDDAPPEACLYAGRAAAQLDDPGAAIAALRRAGPSSEAAGLLADAIFDDGKPETAFALALQTLSRDADEARSLTVAAKLLLARGETRRLLALCRELRARGGRNAKILAFLALAAWAEGAPECGVLLDRARWLSEGPLPGEDRNAALAGEILGHGALGRSPGYKATKGEGLRIDQLQSYGGPEARALLARICDAVSEYAAARTDHPALADLPGPVRLNAWALVLRGGGHEDWHIHPAARISGVYYVAVPDGGEGAGAIGFGPLRGVAGRDMRGFPSWTIAPRAGDILLFPSYFAHKTWPTHSAAPRISVAFDVVPAA